MSGHSMHNRQTTHHISPYKVYLWVSVITAAVSYAAVTLIFQHLLIVLRAFLAMTLTGVVLMGFDKQIAGKGGLRVPEIIFWGVAALGGALGVFLGMQIFRHKTRKPQFLFLLLGLFVVQLFIGKMVAQHLGITSLRALLGG
jgi:uncharacterized membrane protein YsdA (DUF1294 family)